MQTPAQGVVMAPVSPAVAKLLHQLQGQLIKEGPALPPGAIVLRPPQKADHQSYYERNGIRQVLCFEGRTRHISLQTPFIADPEYWWLRPGIWYGSETRSDETGSTWTRSLPNHYVVDDFGQLVPTEKA